MSIAEVTLTEVLLFRDARADIQQRLLKEYGCPMVSFTMNIAGPVKRSAAGDILFRDTVERLISVLGEPLYREILQCNAGNEAFLVYDMEAEQLKLACMKLEEDGEAGRLLDIDVLDKTGEKLSRPQERRCLICGGPVAPCARSRTHTPAQLREKTDRILNEYAEKRLGDLAVQALLDEVRLTPKPGLVDSDNSGAHRDMDLMLMEKSAESLREYFVTATGLGRSEGAGCAAKLQQAGIEAERTMRAATNGVNTHKGAIFGMGLLTAGAGMLLSGNGSSVTENAAAITEGLQLILQNSHGEKVLKDPSAGGARWEARLGFPHARAAYEVMKDGGSRLRALLTVIAELNDTNLLWRGGEEGLLYLQREAKRLLMLPEEELEDAVRILDTECIRRNLSPGGAADLFACGLFLQSAEQLLK